MPPRRAPQVRIAEDIESKLRDRMERSGASMAIEVDALLRRALGLNTDVTTSAAARGGAPSISAPRRSGYVDPRECRHPVGRRIGDTCGQCGTRTGKSASA